MYSRAQSIAEDVRRAYWCARARRFVTPSDPAYDPLEYEKLTQGPLERGDWGDDDMDDSGCYRID